jgi:dipeptidyl aminopeptidase/acylaminoacyl peptidase
VLEAIKYDEDTDSFALVFSTATSPTQIYTIEGEDRDQLIRHTNETILGIPQEVLSPGEDLSYTSFDGLRVSARLYMPSPKLGFKGKRPVVYYLHGGPQGQERPDFSWFSMPLIQFLTIQGFAVFVPNVRGSTGYGLSYTKHVDRDWGGKDRLDHVHAMQEVLPKDDRLNVSRAGVVGRSYGGYMALTLAGRHPDLLAAAVDMFGPYDLVTFMERIPPTWKPYFYVALGNPENPEELEFLRERSPKTYIENIKFPMLVIQGRNDPRVVAEESEDLVKHLQDIGKDVELLLFENEGHGVEKYENKVTCYNAITNFFKETLKP